MLPPPMKVMFMRRGPVWPRSLTGSPVSLIGAPPLAARRERRGPNSALPMRTIVAPSAIADSRSAVIPIDSVSAASPAWRARSSRSRRLRNCARCSVVSGVSAAIPMNPRKASRGSCATARARSSACAGTQPLLLGSAEMFTCTHTFSAPRPWSRAADRRSAMARRSTLCTHAKWPPRRGPCCPAKDRSGAIRPPASRASASCPGLLNVVAEGTLAQGVHGTNRLRGWVLLTARTDTLPGSRPAAAAAAAIRSRTACHVFSYRVIIR